MFLCAATNDAERQTSATSWSAIKIGAPGQGVPGPSLEETRKIVRRAQRQVQATLLVEKISQLENIEVSDKEVQERVENLTRLPVTGKSVTRGLLVRIRGTICVPRWFLIAHWVFCSNERLLRRSIRPPQRLMNKAKMLFLWLRSFLRNELYSYCR